MSAMEINASSSVCRRCGLAYGRIRGNFSVNYGPLYKGNGYLPYCHKCVDELYESYLNESKSALSAVRQMCRKLDIYWNQGVFASIERKNSNRSMMTGYLTAINNTKYAGKCYDDTLREYNSLWSFGVAGLMKGDSSGAADCGKQSHGKVAHESSTEDIKAFWGPGYTAQMYQELDERYKYWLDQYPEDTELTVGEIALLRQICNLEISIAHNRSQGKSIEKEVNSLNSLIGSMNLRPDKKKSLEGSLDESTPFGVWIRKIEDTRPLAEPDPQFKDVDGIRKYITVWFFGHLCKMLKIKNTYSKLYEEEMEKLRVERPEYKGEDEEAIMEDIFHRADTSDEQFSDEYND